MAQRGRPRDPNSRRSGERQAAALRKGAIRTATLMARIVDELPPIDITDPKQVSDRCNEYFDLCEEHETHPTISGISAALGTTADAIRRVSLGNQATIKGRRIPDSVLEVLAKKFAMFEEIWESTFLAGGYANPVVGIFYSKNNFGYTDTREVRSTNVELKADVASIVDKYRAAMPQHVGKDGKVAKLQAATNMEHSAEFAVGLQDRLGRSVVEVDAEVVDTEPNGEDERGGEQPTPAN